jgi:hypothetical protein
MTILEKRNYKRFGAATFGLAALLVASVATAGHGGYGGDPSEDDDDKDEDDKDDDKKGGKHKEPRFEDEGDSLRATAVVRGLKHNKNVKVELNAIAKVKLRCEDKKNHKKNYTKTVEIELEGEEFFSKKQIDDGKLRVEVETEDAEDALRDYDDDKGDDDKDNDWGDKHDDDDKDYEDYGCGKKYDTKIKQVRFLDAKLEVRQGNREVVTWLCTFEPPTRDGEIDRDDVECHKLND